MRRSLYPQVAVLLFVALFLAIRTAEGQCATVLWSTFGTSGGTGFGSAVASVGDINADGVPDFVVGAPSAASGSSSSLPGQARVFSGTDGSPLQVYSGANSGDRFGAAVAGAGDFNGDGTGDVLVGAPAGSSFPSGPGHAYVFSGSNGSTLLTLSGPPGFGDAVASAGDL
ncbi:MAG TPA: integrin alpha, partial [Planctomycetota bacterium]|nr:integrin alpha [Planctomycetota bacterium]